MTSSCRPKRPRVDGRPSRPTTALIACLSLVGAYRTAVAQQAPPGQSVRTPSMADRIKATVYADNAFTLFVNGKLIAVDSIEFIPHNVIAVDILPAYPMTIAVLARDNADPTTGMEYANTQIGDGGFILKFGDGTVNNGLWNAKRFSHAPVDGDTRDPRTVNTLLPDDWFTVDFDDRDWPRAREYPEADIDLT